MARLGDRTKAALAGQGARRWGYGLGAVVLAVSGLFGGWKPAPPPPPAQAGTVIDAGPWRVNIRDARLTGELEPMLLIKKENHFIVVVATTEITGDETWKGISSILELSGVDGVDKPYPAGVVLMRDATKIGQLHPGMPEQVAYFWERAAGSPAPTEIIVRVKAYEYRANSLTDHMEWLPLPEADTGVRVPVIDKREVPS